mmetsp:Transcript_9778/g.16028  ORF Transcript_9778/g.16028 Transcript_9778/m.16028 type:complete len:264 (-) Transcript_9778:2332-3123(-)
MAKAMSLVLASTGTASPLLSTPCMKPMMIKSTADANFRVDHAMAVAGAPVRSTRIEGDTGSLFRGFNVVLVHCTAKYLQSWDAITLAVVNEVQVVPSALTNSGKPAATPLLSGTVILSTPVTLSRYTAKYGSNWHEAKRVPAGNMATALGLVVSMGKGVDAGLGASASSSFTETAAGNRVGFGVISSGRGEGVGGGSSGVGVNEGSRLGVGVGGNTPGTIKASGMRSRVMELSDGLCVEAYRKRTGTEERERERSNQRTKGGL